MLPEDIRIPEGTFVELVTIESKALEPSKEAKRKFWELIGAEESE